MASAQQLQVTRGPQRVPRRLADCRTRNVIVARLKQQVHSVQWSAAHARAATHNLSTRNVRHLVAWAAAEGHADMLATLCQAHRQQATLYRLRHLLRLAARHGHSRAVRVLQSFVPDPDVVRALFRLQVTHVNSPLYNWAFGALFEAARNGHGDCVQSLHFARMQELFTNAAAVRAAAEEGHAGIVEWLVPRASAQDLAAIAAHKSLALRRAARRGHADVVRALLGIPNRRGGNPGACGHYALRWAARRGHAHVARVLLEWYAGHSAEAAEAATSMLAHPHARGAWEGLVALCAHVPTWTHIVGTQAPDTLRLAYGEAKWRGATAGAVAQGRRTMVLVRHARRAARRRQQCMRV